MLSDLFTMDFFQVYSQTFAYLIIFTMYLTRSRTLAAQKPLLDQSHIDQQLVANDNTELVTLGNQKPLGKNTTVPADLVSRDNRDLVTTPNPPAPTPVVMNNDTRQRNVENLVTTDDYLTWTAVTNGNNADVTTGVAPETIPALQSHPGHDNGDSESPQPVTLKPRSGLHLSNDRQNNLLQRSKTVDDFTSSDFTVEGRDIITVHPEDIIVKQDQSSDRNPQIEQSAQDNTSHLENISGIVDSTSGDPGNSGDFSSTESSISSARFEHGITLTGFTDEIPGQVTKNSQSQSTVISPITRSESVFVTLLVSSTASSEPEPGIQTDPSPSHYSTISAQHEELSTQKLVDLFSPPTKFPSAGTSRETATVDLLQTESNPSTQSVRITTFPTASSSGIASISNHPSKVSTLPTQNPTLNTSTLPTSGSGDIHENDLSPGQTSRSTQGQSPTTLTPKATHIGGTQTITTTTTTTTMVYIASSDVADTGGNFFDGFDGIDGRSDFKVRDIILAVSGTVGCMLTMCMLVAFTRCCCKKEKVRKSYHFLCWIQSQKGNNPESSCDDW